MAQSIDSRALNTSQESERAAASLWKLRLLAGWTVLFASLVGLFAVIWDIQWHAAVGRDRTLTAPHLFILGSATLLGITALAAVLIETGWARRSALVAKSGTAFAGFFSSSVGAYLVGYGALATAIAFPIDQYWHTLYGIDVAVWAPFHVMGLTGFSVCCLGVACTLVEGAHLAAQQGAKGAARAGYSSAVVAFAVLMGFLSILLQEALRTGYISLGSLTFTVYPLMLGAFGTFVLMAARRALPWRWTATCVALIYAIFGLLSYLLVPPLMTWLLRVEQQNLLQGASTVPVLALTWQYPLVIAALLLDGVTWLARSRGWSARRRNRATLVAASVGMTLVALFSPFIFSSQFLISTQRRAFAADRVAGATGEFAAHAGKAVQGAPTGLNMIVVVIVVVSLLLGLLGVYVGNRLGAGIGELMQRKEQ